MLRRFPIACSLVALVGSVTVAVLTVGAMSPANAASATDWKTVSAGNSHTCAIRSIGKLYCWGNDDSGKLGNGSGNTADVVSPQQITAATDWKTVTVGYSHTCAIRSTGKLYCWGSDYYGQVGNGSGNTAEVVSPKQITAATDWKTVSAGNSHTCAIRSTGKLYCWGRDFYGQVGNGSGSNTDVVSPKQITTATDWKSVSAGYHHTCATRGKLYCWGFDVNGQIGNGGSNPGPNVHLPQQITTATDWKTVSAGGDHTCAIRSIGKLYCWGFDFYGQLGNGAGGTVTSPTQITAATDWKSVSAATDHTCATRGKLHCWGYDGWGQVGNGSGSDEPVVSPQQVTSATDWRSVSGGGSHTCAIRSIGKLYCWGRDNYGQIGNGAGGDTTSPSQI